MLPGQTSCCRAVKRQLRPPSEGVWISDATLAWAFQRLCVISRPSRRNGTSVPGPMECRRRLGKRRMTHFSNVVHSPMQDFAALWGMGTSKESNRWQWEAPSLSPSKDTTNSIPFWLTEHDRIAVDGPISTQEDDKIELHIAPQSNAGDDLKQFRDLMRSGIPADSVLEVCGGFCQRFKQSLSLGQVSTDIIASSIREVPSDIRKNAANKDLEYAACISFYNSIWEGVLACKVLQPAELGLDVLRLLLTRLLKLPVHLSGTLLTDILNSITDCQKRGLKQEICAIGISCFASSTKVSDSRNLSTSSYGCSRYPASPNKAALDVKIMENLVQALVQSVGVYSSEKANKHLRDLAHVSTAYVARAILSDYNGPLRELKEMRKAWLEFISRIPYGSENLLVEACMILEAEDHNSGLKIVPQLSVHGLCDVLLEHWANKTPGTSMLNAHTTFKAAILKQGSGDDSIVHLCRALEQHSIPWHKEVRCLLQVLRRVRGVTASSYFCLRRLEDAQIYLDTTVLADELAALSSNNIGYARDLFDRYSKGRPSTYSLALECFPDLAVAMINSPSCNPDEIWQALGGRKIWKEKWINKARIRLVKRMALEFSQAKFISTRVAFRNVVRCYRYLSYHGVPISSDIARILTYIGIERNILEKGSISQGRLHWALGIIARVEGVGIARRMETAVISAQDREKNLRIRDQNPLNLGPID